MSERNYGPWATSTCDRCGNEFLVARTRKREVAGDEELLCPICQAFDAGVRHAEAGLRAEVATLREALGDAMTHIEIEQREHEETKGYRQHAEQERDALRERVYYQTDWYQQRFNRLRKWVDEEVAPLSEDVRLRYYAICANGSPAPHESADWSGTMHSLTLQLDHTKHERDTLRAVAKEALEDCEYAIENINEDHFQEGAANVEDAIEVLRAVLGGEK